MPNVQSKGLPANTVASRQVAKLLAGLLKAHATTQTDFSANPFKILMVEGNAFSLDLLEYTFKPLLGRYKAQVVRAYNGKMGLRLILEERPAVVIFNLHLPLMTGMEMLEGLKSSPAWAEGYQPFLIALSTNPSTLHIEEAMALGVDNYYTKPFNPLAMLEKVENLILKDDYSTGRTLQRASQMSSTSAV